MIKDKKETLIINNSTIFIIINNNKNKRCPKILYNFKNLKQSKKTKIKKHCNFIKILYN